MVGGVAALAAHESHNGRYVDDRAAAGLPHLLYGMLCAKEYAGGVDVHNALPAGSVQAVGFGAAADAGVVDEDVQPAVAGDGLGDEVLPACLIGDVCVYEGRVSACLGDLGFDLAG